jgi:catechol 2,3-dioxygenase-like lactoylglutathione lyase family enzyme
MPNLIQVVPTLEVNDVVASEAFYREKLGFKPGHFFGEPPTFCIIGRDRISIFLDKSRTPRLAPLNQYWAAYVYVDNDVDALASEFALRGVEITREPEDQPYGCRDFDIRDPDGHMIGFGKETGAS